jgi:hypothetical protein
LDAAVDAAAVWGSAVDVDGDEQPASPATSRTATDTNRGRFGPGFELKFTIVDAPPWRDRDVLN